jgi:hypothetical protein
MTLTFYPYAEDAQKGSLTERIDILMEAAEHYKAVVLDAASEGSERSVVPREQTIAYNWDEIAKVLREVREMPEASKEDKHNKASLLKKLAEVYEVLRCAKMSKLEAVRLALISEATSLENSATG